MERCQWCCDGGMLQAYHDAEWGVPVHEDRLHFEYLTLEAMQCGLSWMLMLKKREIFRACFAGFDPKAVAAFTGADVEAILATEGMIRSRRKVEAVIGNAQAFLRVAEAHGSFDRYLWGFTDGRTMVYPQHQQGQWETRNALSDAISGDLRRWGFRYLGSVTVYSYLQSCGVINDHEPGCWMYAKLLAAQQREVRGQ